MPENNDAHAQVLSGVLSNVKVKNTTADIFFRAGDAEGMAATGVIAAAMGLSGAAAGMAAMSMDEMKEPVCQVSFDIDGKHVEALLWNWPFKDGDEVQTVVEPAPSGDYIGFAVLDPKDQVIVLYPHVSAGGKAHWKDVRKFAALVIGGVNILIWAFFLAIYILVEDVEYKTVIIGALGGGAGILVIFGWISYNIGNRFTPFIEIAEPIFTLLGWKDVKNINLRKITKAKKKPTDPPAMGDSYFRY
ncbi:putative type VI secretion system effector [Xanthomonas oryzae]|uniref:putative type VI secretion system effector n=1 Tax=Xanthomonas oryzae TaxID=347 RepID=UPI0002DBAFA8|nr:putative type VI secretion system effector [Xanthomonas oryzae]